MEVVGLVDGAYTYCCIQAGLESLGFACTDSSACSRRLTALHSGPVPVLLELVVCLQPPLVVVVAHQVRATYWRQMISSSSAVQKAQYISAG